MKNIKKVLGIIIIIIILSIFLNKNNLFNKEILEKKELKEPTITDINIYNYEDLNISPIANKETMKKHRLYLEDIYKQMSNNEYDHDFILNKINESDTIEQLFNLIYDIDMINRSYDFKGDRINYGETYSWTNYDEYPKIMQDKLLINAAFVNLTSEEIYDIYLKDKIENDYLNYGNGVDFWDYIDANKKDKKIKKHNIRNARSSTIELLDEFNDNNRLKKNIEYLLGKIADIYGVVLDLKFIDNKIYISETMLIEDLLKDYKKDFEEIFSSPNKYGEELTEEDKKYANLLLNDLEYFMRHEVGVNEDILLKMLEEGIEKTGKFGPYISGELPFDYELGGSKLTESKDIALEYYSRGHMSNYGRSTNIYEEYLKKNKIDASDLSNNYVLERDFDSKSRILKALESIIKSFDLEVANKNLLKDWDNRIYSSELK